MAYAKTWVPPSLALRANLPAWKSILGDLHDNILAAGLDWVREDGDLDDFDGVEVLPNNGAYPHYRVYGFNDALQADAPIHLKLHFGCGALGLGNTSRILQTISIRTEVLFKGSVVYEFYNPQSQNASTSNNLTTGSDPTILGSSYISRSADDGFFGVCYGAGSRYSNRGIYEYWYYRGATYTCFIQRTTGVSGSPSADGVMIYAPKFYLVSNDNTKNHWISGVFPAAEAAISFGGPAIASARTAPRIGGPGIGSSLDGVLLERIYMPVPGLDLPSMPFVYSVYYEAMPEGTVFDHDGRSYICIGRETNISVDAIDGQRAAIVMLYEND